MSAPVGAPAAQRDVREIPEAARQQADLVLPRSVSTAGLHWLKPKLVGEVAFTEWTNDGVVHHPSFQGMREDKRASEVVIERPVGEPGLKVYSHWLRSARPSRVSHEK